MGKKRTRSQIKSCDKTSDEESDGPEVEDKAPNVEKQFKEVLSKWDAFVVSSKGLLRDLPNDLSQWRKQYKSKRKVKCPLKDCPQTFTTILGLKYHYQRCGISFQFVWKCKVCGFEAAKGNRLIVQHLWANHKDLLPTISPEIAGIIENANTVAVNASTINRQNKRSENRSVVHKFHERFYANKSFPHLKPKSDSWIVLPQDEYCSYIPNTDPSISFKSTKERNSSWHRLNLFDSVVTGPHVSFYVGGPVWATAWCPVPYNVSDCDQYLAVASNMKFDVNHTLNKTDIEPGVVQIWNFGQLRTKFDPKLKPRVALSVAHLCGMVWDMEWCPGGTTWEQSTSATSDSLPRLGLLAIACGDGCVRIHSIPHPESLKNSSDTPTLYHNDPVMILNPPDVSISVRSEKTVCKCIAWIHTSDQHLIAAGYGSGLIAVWDLTTKSSLLVIETNAVQTVLRPIASWLGHSALVSKVKWVHCSSDTFLVTCSFDRSAKLWNLDDLASPVTVVKKGLMTALDTHLQFNGMFFSNDDCYLGFQNNVYFKDFGFDNYPAICLSSHKSCVWDLSVSEWTSATASVDAAGEAVLFPNFRLLAKSKRKAYDRIPLYHTSYVSLEERSATASKSKKRNKNSDNVANIHDRPPIRSYTEFVDKFGIVFNDHNLSEEKVIPIDEINRIRLSTHMNYQRLNDYPIVSLNKVSFNPNHSSYTWVATAAQSGLCRLSSLAFLSGLDQRN